MTTQTATIAFAVLNPIGGSPRAQVCSVHSTHVGAHRRLSPGRVVGPVPAGTEPLANVPLTTTRGAIMREVARVLGDDVSVYVDCDGTSGATVLIGDPRGPSFGQPPEARVEPLLAALSALPDDAGEDALRAAVASAARW